MTWAFSSDQDPKTALFSGLLGKGPTYSGLALVSWVAAFGVAGPLLGRADARVKRLAAPVGTLVLAVAFAGIAATVRIGLDAGGALLMIMLGLGGLGYGAAFSGTLAHLTSTVTDRYAADVSGLFNTTLQAGGALGVAVFGTIYLDLAPHAGQTAADHAFLVTTTAMAATAAVAAFLANRAVRQEES